ncbi:MAG: hypothetical protein KDC32_00575 [Saprospiraceae bacterium]|nr:hypothetical protein [Saprospiraceae bacterium]MCB0677869.1 hypothetical protein [Saprospiraceae bacterium]MCB0679455.1 hypothetical protein [Saprospiraceae bacterium]
MAHTRNCFISVIGVVGKPEQLPLLPAYLTGLCRELSASFADYEVILVNNLPLQGEIEQAVAPLPEEMRQSVFLINLSSTVNKNHAIMAGLERANGDYSAIFEFLFLEQPALVTALYDKSQEGFDIVYLRAPRRETRGPGALFYRLFYYILRHYSDLKVDEKAHDTRLISRRALNSMLRLRENLRYMKAIYAMIGYRTEALPVDEPLHRDRDRFSDQFRTSLLAITSYTSFLRTLLLWIFLFSLFFLGLVVFNAVKVKLTNVDLLGNYHQTVSGWTFLVVLISIFFAITCLNLYIMSIYLSNIYNEIKQRPLYIIESVKRF